MEKKNRSQVDKKIEGEVQPTDFAVPMYPWTFEPFVRYSDSALDSYIITENKSEEDTVTDPANITGNTSIEEARYLELMAKVDNLMETHGQKLDKILDKQDIHDQKIEETKDLIRYGNLTIIDCVKFNATRNIQLLCLFGILVTVFSLLISLSIKIHLINPFFAILMLIASTGFYVMTKVEEITQKNR